MDYRNIYRQKNYDTISLILPKGYKDKIKEAAKEKSLNEYIKKAIDEKIERGD